MSHLVIKYYKFNKIMSLTENEGESRKVASRRWPARSNNDGMESCRGVEFHDRVAAASMFLMGEWRCGLPTASEER